MSDNLRPQYCCGKCPPIEGGGYDCTCLFVKDCPMYNTIYGAWTRFSTALLQPFVDIYERFNMWNWKRKKETMTDSMRGITPRCFICQAQDNLTLIEPPTYICQNHADGEGQPYLKTGGHIE